MSHMVFQGEPRLGPRELGRCGGCCAPVAGPGPGPGAAAGFSGPVEPRGAGAAGAERAGGEGSEAEGASADACCGAVHDVPLLQDVVERVPVQEHHPTMQCTVRERSGDTMSSSSATASPSPARAAARDSPVGGYAPSASTTVCASSTAPSLTALSAAGVAAAAANSR